MDREARELRIKSLWSSKGSLHCLDCRELIVEGLPYWNVYLGGCVIGGVHSLDGNCQNGCNPVKEKDENQPACNCNA